VLYPYFHVPYPIEDETRDSTGMLHVVRDIELSCSAGLRSLITAKRWLDCGFQVNFDELTALCISGVLTLDHALRVVAGRVGSFEALGLGV
jgi:hypothetical protein